MRNKKVTADLSYVIWVLSVVCTWIIFLIYAVISRKYNIRVHTIKFIVCLVIMIAGKYALHNEKITGSYKISPMILTGILGIPYILIPGCGSVALIVPLIYGFSGMLCDEYGDSYIFDLRQCATAGITASILIMIKTFTDRVVFSSIDAKIISFIMNMFIILGVFAQTTLLFYHMESKQEELIENIDTVKEEATTDPLTGIQNRSMLNEVIKQQQNSIDTFSIIILDIDDFKKVNDNYGHVFGDMVLKRLAKILIKVSEDHSIPFRYGGEEFVVVCKNRDLERTKELAEKIRIGFKNSKFQTNEKSDLHFTVSIGITEVPYGENVSATELLARSDEALYQAKKTGKDKVVVFGQLRNT